MLKKAWTAFVCGVAFMAATALVGAGIGGARAWISNIPIFSGPAGSNPTADFPPATGTFNELIGSINGELTNWVSFGNAGESGEMAVSSTNGFATNGSVATALGSVGPTGSRTSVQEWLAVVDETGKVVYVPAF